METFLQQFGSFSNPSTAPSDPTPASTPAVLADFAVPSPTCQGLQNKTIYIYVWTLAKYFIPYYAYFRTWRQNTHALTRSYMNIYDVKIPLRQNQTVQHVSYGLMCLNSSHSKYCGAIPLVLNWPIQKNPCHLELLAQAPHAGFLIFQPSESCSWVRIAIIPFFGVAATYAKDLKPPGSLKLHDRMVFPCFSWVVPVCPYQKKQRSPNFGHTTYPWATGFRCCCSNRETWCGRHCV